MDVLVDSTPHPLYLDKEYDTKESFQAACVLHNRKLGKECFFPKCEPLRVKCACSVDSCEVN